MEQQVPRKPSSPDGAKNVTLSVRITAKSRFGLELMSRLHRRTIPEVVSYAIEEVFTSEIEGLFDDRGAPETGGKRYLLPLLWAERPSDRLANIALHCPELLLPSEKRMWTHITTLPNLWRGTGRAPADLEREALAAHWSSIEHEFSLGSRSHGAV